MKKVNAKFVAFCVGLGLMMLTSMSLGAAVDTTVNGCSLQFDGTDKYSYIDKDTDHQRYRIKFDDPSKSGSFTIANGDIALVRVLVVGGGGAGGTTSSNNAGGGGGAGGCYEITNYLYAGKYTVKVGAGGQKASEDGTWPGALGEASYVQYANGAYLCVGQGGGGGGTASYGNTDGTDGGSGGGAAWFNKVAGVAGGYVKGQGSVGGVPTIPGVAGGGGGARGAGGADGTGGEGFSSDIFNPGGEATLYAVGGAGGNREATVDAADGKGYGYGGAGGNQGKGGKGGDGAVVVLIESLKHIEEVDYPSYTPGFTLKNDGFETVTAFDKNTATNAAGASISDAIQKVEGTTSVKAGIQGTTTNGMGHYQFTVYLKTGYVWKESGTANPYLCNWRVVPDLAATDSTIDVNKRVVWSESDDEVASNAVITVASFSEPAMNPVYPKVLFIAGVCGAHSQEATTITTMLTAAAENSDVDCWLVANTNNYPKWTPLLKHFSHGTTVTLDDIKERTNSSEKTGLNKENHTIMIPMMEVIMKTLKADYPTKYDYIVFEFDGNRIGNYSGNDYAMRDYAMANAEKVAGLLDDYYKNERVLWIVDECDTTHNQNDPFKTAYFTPSQWCDMYTGTTVADITRYVGEVALLDPGAILRPSDTTYYKGTRKASRTLTGTSITKEITFGYASTASYTVSSSGGSSTITVYGNRRNAKQTYYNDSTKVSTLLRSEIKPVAYNLKFHDVVQKDTGLVIDSVHAEICTNQASSYTEEQAVPADRWEWIADWQKGNAKPTYNTAKSAIIDHMSFSVTNDHEVTLILTNLDFAAWTRMKISVSDPTGSFRTSAGAEWNSETQQWEKNPNDGNAKVSMIEFKEDGSEVPTDVEGEASTAVNWQFTAYDVYAYADYGRVFMNGLAETNYMAFAGGYNPNIQYVAYAGYKLEHLIVDGKEIAITNGPSGNENSYTFKKINHDHEIVLDYERYVGTTTAANTNVVYDGQAHLFSVVLNDFGTNYELKVCYSTAANGTYTNETAFLAAQTKNGDDNVGTYTYHYRVYAKQPTSFDASGNPVYEWVPITDAESAQVTIMKRTLNVTAKSFHLDDAPYTAPAWKGVETRAGELIAGDSINAAALTGSIVDYKPYEGQYVIKLAYAENKGNDDVAGGNYEVRLHDGVLSVIRSPISIGGVAQFPLPWMNPDEPGFDTGVDRVEHEYDGTSVGLVVDVTDPSGSGKTKIEWSEDGGKTWLSAQPRYQHVGVYTNYYAVTAIGDVADTYFPATNYQYVIITPRKVTVTSGTDTKKYDGTPLTKKTVEVVSGSLIAGDGFSDINCPKAQTEVGSTANDGYMFGISGTVGSYLSDYEFTKLNGTLTVEAQTMKFKGRDGVEVEQSDDPDWPLNPANDGVDDLVSVYDGKGTNLVIDVTRPAGGTAKILYSLDKKTWSEDLELTNFCEKVQMFFAVEQPGYVAVTNYAFVTIQKRPIVIAADRKRVFLHEDLPELTATTTNAAECDLPITNVVKYVLACKDYDKDTAGTYAINFTVKPDSTENYTITYEDNSVVVTVDPLTEIGHIEQPSDPSQPLDPEDEKVNTGVPKVEKYYDGIPTNIIVDVTVPGVDSPDRTGMTIMYSTSENGSWGEMPIQYTDVSTNKVWYAVTIPPTSKGLKYPAVTNYQWIVIKPRPVKLTSATESWTYDEKVHSNTTVTATSIAGDAGFIGADGVTTNGFTTITNVGTNDNVFGWDFHSSMTAAQRVNYAVSCETGTIAVTKRKITNDNITFNFDTGDFTYNGDEQGPIVTSITVDGITFEVSDFEFGGNRGTNAGPYQVYVIKTSPNFEIEEGCDPKGDWSIKKAPLTIKADDKEVTYGEDFKESNYSWTGDGFVKDEGEADLGGSASFSTSYVKGHTAGYVDSISVTGFTSPNYEITFKDGSMIVQKAILNLPVGAQNLIYDGTEQTGLADGKGYTVVGGGTGTNAGDDYEAEVAIDPNYTWWDGTKENKRVAWKILKRPLVLRSTSQDKPYDGDPLAVSEATIRPEGSGYAAGECFDYSGFASIVDLGSTVAKFSYAESATAKLSNYSVSTEYGTLTITPATDQIVAMPANGTWAYDGEKHFTNGWTVVNSNKVAKGDYVRCVVDTNECYVTYPDDGIVTNRFLSTGIYRMVGGVETNVTANYNFTNTVGFLEITNASIRILNLDRLSTNVVYDATGYTIGTPDVETAGGATATIAYCATKNGTFTSDKPSFVNVKGAGDAYATWFEVSAPYHTTVTNSATVTIARRPITFTSKDQSHEYPATLSTAVGDGDITVGGDGFAAVGETASYTSTATISEVGHTNAAFDVTFTGDALANNYSVTKNYGTLTVASPGAVILVAGSETWIYNGRVHTNHTFTAYTNGAEVAGGILAGGKYIKAEFSSASAVTLPTVDPVENVIVTARVYSVVGDIEDTSYTNYQFQSGWLTVEKADIEGFDVISTNAVYDGRSYTVGVVPPTNTLNAAIGYSTSVNGPFELTIPDFKDAKEYTVYVQASAVGYNSLVKSATVTITRRPVTLVSGSATKKYDTTPLTCQEVTVKGGDGYLNFVYGEGLASFDCTGSQTTEGNTGNTFTYEFDANTKANNYDITKINGTLTVVAGDMPIAGTDWTGPYDGSPHSIGLAGEPPPGVKIAYTTTPEIQTSYVEDANPGYTDVGVYTVWVKISAPNYAQTELDYKVTIEPRELSLTPPDKDKKYDGKELTFGKSEIIPGKLGYAPGECFDYDGFSSQTVVGKTASTFAYHGNATTKESNYAVTIVDGKYLTVKPSDQQVVATPLSWTWTFDGKEHSTNAWTITNEDLFRKYGDEFQGEVDVANCKVKYPTTTPSNSWFKTARIVRWNADEGKYEDRTSNYDFLAATGSLAVVNAKIALADDDLGYDGIYNGAAHSIKTPSVTVAGGVEASVKILYSTAKEGPYGVDKPTCKHVDVETPTHTVWFTVTADYHDAITNSATVTIRKRSVVYASKDDSRVYNAKPLYATPALLEEGDGFVTGEGAETTGYASITEPGECPATYTVTCRAGTAADDYSIETRYGKLTVLDPSEIGVQAASATWKFDGGSHTTNGFEIVGDKLNENDVFTVEMTAGSKITYPDETVENLIKTVTVKRAGVDVTANYTFKYLPGQLAVTPIDFEGLDVTGVTTNYDGTGYSVSGVVTGAVIGNRDDISYTFSENPDGPWGAAPKYTNAGTRVTYVRASLRGYNDKIVPGTVTILPRAITLLTGTASKVYDGTPLTNNTIRVVAGSFVAGEGIASNVAQSAQTDAGSTDNMVKYFLKDNTLAGNYDITPTHGRLTVTPIEIDIPKQARDFVYNGGLQTGITDGRGYYVTGGNTGTNADDYVATVCPSNNYAWTGGGTGEAKAPWSIRKRRVSLTPPSKDKEFDNLPLTFDGTEITPGDEGYAPGECFEYSDFSSRTELGSTPSSFKYADKGVTKESNYDVTVVGDKYLTIKPNGEQIVATPVSCTWVYDGEVHFTNAWTIANAEKFEGYGDEFRGLVATNVCKVSTPDDGIVSNWFEFASIGHYDEDGKTWIDTTARYNFSVATGLLEVVNAKLVVTNTASLPYDRKYDGEAHSIGTPGVRSVNGQTVTVTYSKTAVGGYGADKPEWKNVEGDEDSHTVWFTAKAKYHDDLVGSSTVTIRRRTLVYTSPDDAKTFDGDPLYAAPVLAACDGFVAGEGAVTNDFASITNPGEQSALYGVVFNSGTSQANYDLTKNYGTLRIYSPDEIGVEAASATWKFDNQPHSTNGFTVGGTLAADIVVCAETSGEVTFPEEGLVDNVITTASVWKVITPGVSSNDVTANYTITLTSGKLNVSAIDFDGLDVDGVTTDYDGAEHSVSAAVRGTPLTQVTYEYSNGEKGPWSPVNFEYVNAGTNTVYCKVSARGYNDLVGSAKVIILPRKVTLLSGTASKVYDGIALTNNELAVVAGSFVKGQGVASNEATSAQLNVGTTDNTFQYYLNDRTDADNYSITPKFGTLTVTPKEIGIPQQAEDYVYNGSLQTGIVDGDGYYVLGGNTGTNAGDYVATVMPSNNYAWIGGSTLAAPAPWHIRRRHVSLTPPSKDKEFDNTDLTFDGTEITPGDEGYAPGECFAYSGFAKRRDIGSTPSTFDYADNGVAKESNYDVTVVGDKFLTVKPNSEQIVATPLSWTWTYDGEVHFTNAWTIANAEKFESYGDEFRGEIATNVCKLTTPGTVSNWFLKAEIGHLDAEGKWTNCTARYNFTVATGLLEVVKAKLELVNDDLDYDELYDGAAHSIREPQVKVQGGVASNVTYSTEKSGTYGAEMPKWTHVEGNEESHTVWYKAAAEHHEDLFGSATVTIRKRKLVYSSPDDSKIYEVGSPLVAKPAYVVTESDGFVGAEGAVTNSFASITDPGSVSATYGVTLTGGAQSRDYSIEKRYGTLTVYDLNTVAIEAASGTWAFDNRIHTTNGWTLVGSAKDARDVFDVEFMDNSKVRYPDESPIANLIRTVTVGRVESAAVTNDVTSEYEIELKPGSLAVTSIDFDGLDTVGVITNYDGAAHSISACVRGTPLTAVKYEYSESAKGPWGIAKFEYVNAGTNTVYCKISARGYNDLVGSAKVVILPRQVTILSGTASKAYDGTPLTDDSFSIISGSFVAGEGIASNKATSAQTSAGTTDNTFQYYLNARTIAENYSITPKFGTLTVTPKEIDVPHQPKSYMYNGSAQTGIVDGEGYYVVDGNVATDVGAYAATVALSNNYAWTGGLTGTAKANWSIRKRRVTLTPPSKTKEFDNTPLTFEDDEIVPGDEEYAPGECFAYSKRSSRTEIGRTASTFEYGDSATAKVSNYEVTVVGEKYLTVEPNSAQIVATPVSATWVYDGEAHFTNAWTIANAAKFTEFGDEFRGEIDTNACRIVVPGVISNWFLKAEIGHYAEPGHEWTNCTIRYNFLMQTGLLEVVKADLEVTNAAALPYDRPYDGAAHSIGVPLVKTAGGQTYKVEYSDSENGPFAAAMPKWTNVEGNEDSHTVWFKVTAANHNELIGSSTVTIRRRALVYHAADASKSFDHTALNADPKLISGTFADGEGSTFANVASIVNPGSTWASFEVKLNTGTLSRNYSITKTWGTLTVYGTDTVGVEASSETWAYDGTAHRTNGFIIVGDKLESNDEFVAEFKRESQIVYPDESPVANVITNVRVWRVTEPGVSSNEVTSSYTINLKPGSLRVTAIDFDGMTVTGVDKAYDGIGSSVTAAATAIRGADPIKYYYSASANGPWSETNPVYTNAGTHTVYCKAMKRGYRDRVESATVAINPRRVTLLSGSATKVFDGTALSNAELRVVSGSFVAGEGLVSSKPTSSQLHAGTTDNMYQYYLNAQTLADNYLITPTFGTLTVTPKEIDIPKQPRDYVYDGEEQTGIVDGPGYYVVSGNTGVDADDYAATVCPSNDYAWVGGSREPAAAPWKILPRTLILNSVDRKWTYDGTEHAVAAADIRPSGMGYAKSECFTYGDFASIVFIGEKPAEFSYRENATTKMSNYDVTPNFGKLKIVPPPDQIVVVPASETWAYDGKAHSNLNWTVLNTDKLKEGDVVKCEIDGERSRITLPEESPVTNFVKTSRIVRMVEGVETDVTANYNFTNSVGYLVVTNASIEILNLDRLSTNLVYDAAAHTIGTPEVKTANDEPAVIRYAMAEDGEYALTKPAYTNVLNAGDAYATWFEVTAPYHTPVTNSATVTIRRRPVAFRSGDITKKIDAVPSIATDLAGIENVTEEPYLGLASGENVTFDTPATLDYVGKIDATFAWHFVWPALEGNYEVTAQNGTLTLFDDKTIIITANDGEWKYDGEAHSNNTCTACTNEILTAGERLEVEYSPLSVLTWPDESPVDNNAVSAKVFSAAGDPETGYDFLFYPGTLKVTPKKITGLEVISTNAVYDGTRYTVGVKLPDPPVPGLKVRYSLKRGDFVETNPDFADAGEYTVYVQATARGYEELVLSGVVTIVPRDVTLVSGSDEKKYDGEPLTKRSVDVKGGEGYVGFVQGEGLKSFVCYGSQTVKGSSGNAFGYTLADNTRAENYIIHLEPGKLEVKAGTMPVGVEDFEGPYDGSAHSVKVTGAEEIHGTVYYTVTPEVEPSYAVNPVSYTDVGEYPVYVKVTADNYEPLYETAWVKIRPRRLSLTPPSKEKKYDGTALTFGANEITPGLEGYATGECFTYFDYSSQTEIGRNASTFGYDGNATTKKSNYDVNVIGDKFLTVKPADTNVAVFAASGIWCYDGGEHSTNGWTVANEELFTKYGDDIKVTIDSSCKVTDPEDGLVSNLVATVKIGQGDAGDDWIDDHTAKYDIVLVAGTLQVTNADLKVLNAEALARGWTGLYDGLAHTNDDPVVETKGGAAYTVRYSTKKSGPFVAGKPSWTDVDAVEPTHTVWYEVTAEHHNALTNSTTVTVLPRKLVYVSDKRSKLYDGDPLEAAPRFVAAESDGFVGAEGAVTNDFASITQPGFVSGSFGVELRNGAKAVDYTIETRFGRLTVYEPNEIGVEAQSKSWKFDNLDHVWHQYDLVNAGALTNDDYLVVTFDESSTVRYPEDGTIENAIESVTVWHDTVPGVSSNEVTKWYHVKPVSGELEIEPSILPDIEVAGVVTNYDGTGHSISVSLKAPLLSAPTNFEYSATAAGPWSKTNPVYSNAGSHVTYCRISARGYEPAIVSAEVLIAPRPITILSASDSKVYDGAALTTNDYELVSGSFVGDEGFDDFTCTGSQTDAGTADNPFQYTLKANTLSDNYTITPKFGTLEVKPGKMKDFTVTPYKDIYDREEHAISVWVDSKYAATVHFSDTNDTDLAYGATCPSYVDVTSTVTYVRITSRNYEPVWTNATVDITPKTLTVIINDHVVNQGQRFATNGLTYVGFVAPDTNTTSFVDPEILGFKFVNTNLLEDATEYTLESNTFKKGFYTITTNDHLFASRNYAPVYSNGILEVKGEYYVVYDPGFNTNGIEGCGVMTNESWILEIPGNLATNRYVRPSDTEGLWNFAGWVTNNIEAVTNNIVFGDGQYVINLEQPERTNTLTAVWTRDYVVHGDLDGEYLSVTVELIPVGARRSYPARVMGKAADCSYIVLLPFAGEYDVVADFVDVRSNVTRVTKLVKVFEPRTEANLEAPSGLWNSKVDNTEAGDWRTIASRLDEIATNSCPTMAGASNVVVDLIVTDKPVSTLTGKEISYHRTIVEHATAVHDSEDDAFCNPERIVRTFDLTVRKITTYTNGTEVTVTTNYPGRTRDAYQSQIDKPVRMLIPFDLEGRTDFWVYRVHEKDDGTYEDVPMKKVPDLATNEVCEVEGWALLNEEGRHYFVVQSKVFSMFGIGFRGAKIRGYDVGGNLPLKWVRRKGYAGYYASLDLENYAGWPNTVSNIVATFPPRYTKQGELYAYLQRQELQSNGKLGKWIKCLDTGITVSNHFVSVNTCTNEVCLFGIPRESDGEYFDPKLSVFAMYFENKIAPEDVTVDRLLTQLTYDSYGWTNTLTFVSNPKYQPLLKKLGAVLQTGGSVGDGMNSELATRASTALAYNTPVADVQDAVCEVTEFKVEDDGISGAVSVGLPGRGAAPGFTATVTLLGAETLTDFVNGNYSYRENVDCVNGAFEKRDAPADCRFFRVSVGVAEIIK